MFVYNIWDCESLVAYMPLDRILFGTLYNEIKPDEFMLLCRQFLSHVSEILEQQNEEQMHMEAEHAKLKTPGTKTIGKK